MKTTRKHVAERAGVSEQTVSYILNGTRKFSPELEQRVRSVMNELGYEPNMIAKGLVTKQSKTLCMVVEDIRNPIFGEIITGFERAAVAGGYFVTLVDAKSDYSNLIKNIIARSFDGVFLSLLPSEDLKQFITRLHKSGIKIVLGNKLDNLCDDISLSCVFVDLYNGMKEILRYLSSLGYTDVAYLSGLNVSDTLDMRFHGFCDGVREIFGKEPNYVESEYPYHTDAESGYKVAEKLLGKQLPQAVVTTNDMMAFGAINCFIDHGIRVPEDIGVIGIDDIMTCEYTSPRLTSLGFYKEEYGKKLYESLYRQITENKTENLAVNCKLTVRGSVAPLNNN